MDWPTPKKKEKRGGVRAGSGRPEGTTKAKMNADRRRAALTGDLPHEFLLRIMRGEMINGIKPDLPTRIDCAKAAAPYYAPKLAQVQVLESLSDEDLDFIIKNAASEIGLSFGTSGVKQETSSPQSPGATDTTQLH